MNKIILASKSEVRKRILLENGISCNVEPSKVDEDVIKDALLKFAISTTDSKKDAARFLGMTYGDFKKTLSRVKVNNYFEERENELESL